MVLDINLFRKEKGNDPDKVRESEKKRGRDGTLVDKVVQLDEQWRKKRWEMDQKAASYNSINKEIGKKKKASKGKDKCEEEMAQIAEIAKEKKILEEEEKELWSELQKHLFNIGNLVHDSVIVSNDEADNSVVRTWGEIKPMKITSKPGFCHHHEILAMIDGYDPKRGQKIAGHRGFFLKGIGALMNMALVNYGMHFLTKHGYTIMQTPFFMKKSIMGKTAQLSDFDEQLYKISAKNNDPESESYLIATSEQPISAYYLNEVLYPEDLPVRFGGFSTCFRKEAGAHGKDTWGIFRIHQFEKVEQFVICPPEKSWDEFEKMISVAEDFYQSLKLPYRVVNIVSGELNDAASKKYDLEAWFPGYGAYRELVSCSNCLDYQSRNLNVRYGVGKVDKNNKKKDVEYVHMLNATLCATERTLCCILENYQTEEGLVIPEVLRPYVGVDFVPYTKPVPKKKDL